MASSQKHSAADIVIVGAGIVGLTLARVLRRRHPGVKTLILEKEPAVGAHASGRSSGVIHAGIYYASDSLKAKFCVSGARLLAAYCAEEGLPLAATGKVIVPTTKDEEAKIPELAERARANGAAVEVIDRRRLAAVEPLAMPASVAIWSPRTATVDPLAVLRRLEETQARDGEAIHFDEPVESVDVASRVITTNRGTYKFGCLVNVAGSFADRIAQQCGAGQRYSVLPFRGSYRELDPRSGLKIRTNIYPVPDPRQPFLGVHFTLAASGKVYVGPTALPVFGRENYAGVRGAEWFDLPARAAALLGMYASDTQGLRGLVRAEFGRLSDRGFWRAAKALVPSLKLEHLLRTGKSGIRAQLYDRESRRLEMDFVVEKKDGCIHVLNAVSPGFTTAFAMAEHLADLVNA